MSKEKGKEVRVFLDSLTSEQKITLIDSFKETMKDLVNSEELRLNELQSEFERITQRLKETESSRNIDDYVERDELYKKKFKLDIDTMSQKNVVLALKNGGSYLSIKNQDGFEYEKIADFRRVDSSNFVFDEETILGSEKPIYVPFLDESTLVASKFVLDSIRVTEDSYLISTKRYKKDNPESNSFVLLTLDQLALTIDYYYTKAKAEAKRKGNEAYERAKESYFRMSEEQRRKYMFPPNLLYGYLPVKVQKQVSKSEWDLMELEEREKYYLPISVKKGKRVSIELDIDSMPSSFHSMYEDFIDKEAIRRDSNGVPNKNGRYANPIVWKYFSDYREMLGYKIKDIKIQREDYSETYKQAVETSFGESNTSDILKSEYGILVKRQNGDVINALETEQIKNAWIKISKVYGNLKPNAEKYNLKISHSGLKLMFAMKALGVYIPKMGTIGVSNKLGEEEFESTFSHEVAHFIDNFIGELNGKRWATDDFESTAGKIAFTFRNSMNKPKKEQSDYINSTKECFARCMQQYFSMKMFGEYAVTRNVDLKKFPEGVPFVKHESFVNQITFESEIIPLIEKFFEENKDVFETTIDLDGTNDIVEVDKTTPEESQEEENLEEVIKGLELLLDIVEQDEKQELLQVIEGLRLLI